jgi:hypothetical protein
MTVFLCAVGVAWLAFDSRAAVAGVGARADRAVRGAGARAPRVGDPGKRARLRVSLYRTVWRASTTAGSSRRRSVEVEERDHLYAGLLDLFGHGFAFERLARRTAGGARATLARLARVRPPAADVPRSTGRRCAISRRELASPRGHSRIAADEPGRMSTTRSLAAWGATRPASGPSSRARGGRRGAAARLDLDCGCSGRVLAFQICGTTFVSWRDSLQLGVELRNAGGVAPGALAGIDRRGRDLARLWCAF